MSDVDIIISEMDDLKSKVDSRKVEICGMEERIEELDELLGVSIFDDEGMIVE
jgi:Fe-S-cluster formation regulator IscX/YfhJ|tara:strand:- start:133 stop:291 length:159 start_codon:yes stop_codon:yes gene_type:complete